MFVWEKKHRLPRECYQGMVTVSFTACILERKEPFRDGAIVEEFLKSLDKARNKNHCSVLIYCFMPDHAHVLLHGLNDAADTWRAMVDFKQMTGFWFGRNLPEIEWQKDFHDHIVRKGEDLGAHVRYIAANPVRKRLVTRWDEYPHTGSLGVELTIIMADAATL